MKNAAHSAWLGELLLCLVYIVSGGVGNVVIVGVSRLGLGWGQQGVR